MKVIAVRWEDSDCSLHTKLVMEWTIEGKGPGLHELPRETSALWQIHTNVTRVQWLLAIISLRIAIGLSQIGLFRPKSDCVWCHGVMIHERDSITNMSSNVLRIEAHKHNQIISNSNNNVTLAL